VELAAKSSPLSGLLTKRKSPRSSPRGGLDQEILDRGGVSGRCSTTRETLDEGEAAGFGRSLLSPGPALSPAKPRFAGESRFRLGRRRFFGASSANRDDLFWQNWLSYPEKFYLAGAVALATFFFGVAGLFSSRRAFHGIAWAGLALTVVLAFSAGYDWHRFQYVKHGVVIQPETVARKGNADNYEPAFNAPLREATEFQLIEPRGDWLLIRLPGGGEGWVEAKSAAVY